MKTRQNVTFIRIGASLLFISVLVGCKIRDPQDVRPVDWYEKHDKERAAMLADCQADPTTADAMPDCKNAARAEENVKSAAK
ncbi:EexN family lipoprotein [Nitrosovibrio sp. Nv4]|uniref:EexN family lipoprotein n=1 Tax=Nitrosovibrio sp. Nv4 TaxID=1945880 RepID=UPI000BC8622A|nr:EexN family lipoprotein [Nitrosovibrio sp. Nv4]SOD41793.1 hypothetical protein SAMN06298226_2096 [Nitrosovibrio sp. Nv4]